MCEQRRLLDLEPEAPELCIFDVFAAHRCSAFLEELCAHGIKHVFVPAGRTGLLQLLGMSVNGHLKKTFRNYSASGTLSKSWKCWTRSLQ